MIWITTDWHLFRKPKGFSEYIKTKNYNKLMDKIHRLVSPNDILLVLGDLSHRENEQVDLKQFNDDIRNFPGYHILIKGNHDVLPDNQYYAVGFDRVCTCGTYDNLIFTHKPVPVGDDEINIHGHIHNDKFVSIDTRHISIPPVEGSEDPPVMTLDDVLRLSCIRKDDFIVTCMEMNPDKEQCHKISTSKDHLINVCDFHEIFDADPADLMHPVDESAVRPACMPNLGHAYIHAAYMKMLEESAKDKIKWVNDKGKEVPKSCPKCGSKVCIFLRGEPVFLCSNKKCRKCFGVVPFSNESTVSLPEKRKLAKERNVPVFICLFHFSSVMSTVIAAVTGDEYTHSAIGFDTSLTDMYSFGKFYPNNPVIGKFVHESLFGPTYNQVTKHAVYVVFVTQEEKDIIKARLEWFIANKGKMRYNYEGLMRSLFHIPEEDGVTKYAYLCSEFVASILKSTGRNFIDTPSNLVKPNDFQQYPWCYFLGSGERRAYDRTAVERRLSEIIAARNRGDELYLETANEIMDESGFKSVLNSDHIQKGKKSLTSFKRIEVTEPIRKKYVKRYPGLRHFNATDERNKAFIWVDQNDNIAAMLYVATFENDSDKRTWIEALEVTPEYKGYGLSKQLLDYATKTLHADALGVARDNEFAQKIYLNYGFKFGDDIGKQDAAGKVNRLMYLSESVQYIKNAQIKITRTRPKWIESSDVEGCVDKAQDVIEEYNKGRNKIPEPKQLFKKTPKPYDILDSIVVSKLIPGGAIIKDATDLATAVFYMWHADNFRILFITHGISIDPRKSVVDAYLMDGYPGSFFKKLHSWKVDVSVFKRVGQNMSNVFSESAENSRKCDLVFLSPDSDWHESVIRPRVPDNYMTRNGYEDNKIPRVCFSTSISKALRALSQNLTGKELYVYTPSVDSHKIVTPTKAQVPDVDIIGERWILEPVSLYSVGKIRVIGDAGKAGIPYKYGNGKTAELYDWKWEWIRYDGQDPDDGTKLIVNEAVSIPNVTNPQDLSNWMNSNISYDHDDRTWKLRSPEQVFTEKKGDCHDQSLFEYTLIKKMGYKCGRVFMIEYIGDTGYIHDAGATHTFCYYIDHGKYYWFENAWGNNAGIHGPYNNYDVMVAGVEQKWQYSGRYDTLFIGKCGSVKPGMDLNDYVNACIPDKMVDPKLLGETTQIARSPKLYYGF